jgi:hypothetical protein
VVQVEPMKPVLKAPGTKRLKLTYDGLFSNVAFNINLRRYAEDAAVAAALEEGARVNPERDDWEAFGGADGAAGGREAEGFDWEAWEAFASREIGDGYGEVPAPSRENGGGGGGAGTEDVYGRKSM